MLFHFEWEQQELLILQGKQDQACAITYAKQTQQTKIFLVVCLLNFFSWLLALVLLWLLKFFSLLVIQICYVMIVNWRQVQLEFFLVTVVALNSFFDSGKNQDAFAFYLQFLILIGFEPYWSVAAGFRDGYLAQWLIYRFLIAECVHDSDSSVDEQPLQICAHERS